MDFKKIISQLNDIEQRQLLQEAEDLMERIHLKDVDATASITDKDQRRQALAKLAKDNGYDGMFDPITGDFIQLNGRAAWIGAYESEVRQLALHNLIPNSAREKTSHLLGAMGMDEKEAGNIANNTAAREKACEEASKLIDQALQSIKKTDYSPKKAEAPQSESAQFRSGLAQALTESFGYNFAHLIEGITREEHKKIKTIIDQVKTVSNDDDVKELLGKFNAYNQQRDALINTIFRLINTIKRIQGLKQPVKESKGNVNNLRERVYGITDGSGIMLELHCYYNDAGMLVEYSLKDFGQDASDMGAGAISGLTFGTGDHILAGVKSLFKGTKFSDEFHREYQKTQAIKKRSPNLYAIGSGIGQIGQFAIPGGAAVKLGLGAAQIGNMIFDPAGKDADRREVEWQKAHPPKDNKKPNKQQAQSQQAQSQQAQTQQAQSQQAQSQQAQNQQGQNQQRQAPQQGAGMSGAPVPEVKQLQQKLMAAGYSVGVHKDDGRFGPDTVKAVKAYTAKNGGNDAANVAKLLGIVAKEPAATAQAQPASESIMYNSMSESERMAYLTRKLDEFLAPAAEVGASILPRLVGSGETAATVLARFGLGAAEAMNVLKPLTNAAGKVVVAGEEWEQAGKTFWTWKNGNIITKSAEDLAAEAKLAGGGKTPPPNIKTRTGGEGEGLPNPANRGKPGFDAEGHPIKVTNNTQQVVGQGNQVAQNGSTINTTHNTYNTYNYSIAGKQVTQAEFVAASGIKKEVIQDLTTMTPKAPGILSGIWKSPVLRKWSWSKAFLATAVGLSIWHLIFDDTGNIVTDDPDVVTPPPHKPEVTPVVPPVVPPVQPGTGDKETNPAQAELDELKDLIRQYTEAFPDDPLPNDIQSQVDTLLKTQVTPGTGDKATTKKTPMSAVDIAAGLKNGSIDPEKGVQ